MSIWDNKVTFCRFLDRAFNNGDLTIIDEIVHPEFVGFISGLSDPIRGTSGCKRWIEQLRNGFGDLNTIVEGNWLIGETGNHEVGKSVTVERIAALVVVKGTHVSDYCAILPTRMNAEWTQVHLLEFEDGKIHRDVVINDTLSALLQLGVKELNAVDVVPFVLPPLI